MKLLVLSLLLCSVTFCLAGKTNIRYVKTKSKKEIEWKNHEGEVWGKNCEFPDEEIESMQASSRKECVSMCQSKESCTHYTWAGNICFLQSNPISLEDAKYKEGSVCGLMLVMDTLNGNEIEWDDEAGIVWGKNCEFHDEEAQQIPATSKNECHMKCKSSKTSCNHFTWFGGICFLQSKQFTVSDASFKEGSVCGVIKGTRAGFNLAWKIGSSGFSFASDCDFFDKDMPGESAADIEQCALVCRNTLGCTHFAWLLPNWCQKKSGIVTKNEALDASGVQCGLLDEQTEPEIIWKEIEPGVEIGTGCAYLPNDLGIELKDNEIECARACQNTPGCTNFDYYKSNRKCNKKKVLNVKKTDAHWGGDGVFCGIIKKIEKKIVCHMWNLARFFAPPYRFLPENVNPNLCTHLIYSFAQLSGNNIVSNENDLFRRTIALKSENPNLKVLISVGGFRESNIPFSLMVNADSFRATFVRQAVQFVIQNKFDGLDIRWENPGDDLVRNPREKENFGKLFTELRKAFDVQGLILSATLSGNEDTISKGYDVPMIANSVDFVNLLTFNYFTPLTSRTTGASAPITTPNNQVSITKTVDAYLSLGMPANKIMMGISFVAPSWTLRNTGQTNMGAQTNGTGVAGRFTLSAGRLSSYEICQHINVNRWTKQVDSRLQIPFIFNREGQWASFEDENSLANKVSFAKSKNLGGIMIWSLDQDDFIGQECGRIKYPLVSFVRSIYLE